MPFFIPALIKVVTVGLAGVSVMRTYSTAKAYNKGKKEGYCEASKEFEEKFAQQAQDYQKQVNIFEQVKKEYDELFEEYELEQKDLEQKLKSLEKQYEVLMQIYNNLTETYNGWIYTLNQEKVSKLQIQEITNTYNALTVYELRGNRYVIR